ncbi:hypothetical protein [Streptomyces sp. NPDC090112]|uniref:hypothetical protein n=1 Tax=Streptomyces sp. NPDC090112 TaxID=3365949 RepID=UPI00381F5ED6
MSGFDFSRWAFLTEPMPAVLAECGAVVEATSDGGSFMGGIRPDTARLSVVISDDVQGVERDLVVRGLLAAWHYVDISDWPVPMFVQGGQP